MILKLKSFFQFQHFHRFCHKWSKPQGNSTDIKIFNVIAKKKVPLIINTPYLTWYSCGPTVYDNTHIGHASSYIRLDIIQRILSQWFDVKMLVAMGVTDIDDKIINKSKDCNVDYSCVAKKYELDFFNSLSLFNIKRPHFVLRVTEHISEIIVFTESLIRMEHAYALQDGTVYFDAQSLANYGKITRAPVLNIEATEPREGKRRHPADFALWKVAKPGEPSWPSPWGAGRPGWHIECSAMASKIFGNKIDIHAGGLDLAFPHHENEEAQSCAFHSTDQWVNYWIHTGHLLMNGMKMSKSMKNFVAVATFLEKYTADDFRMLCLMTHYRSGIDYTHDVMKKAVSILQKFKTFLGDARSYCNGTWDRGNISSPLLMQLLESTEIEVKKCLADDFNTAQSVNLVENLVKATNTMLYADPVKGASRSVVEVALVAEFTKDFLSKLGLLQSAPVADSSSEDFIIRKSIKFRKEIRLLAKSLEDKQTRKLLLEMCDSFRANLKSVDVVIKDT